MKSTAKILLLVLLTISCYSCNSQRPVNYSMTHSQGFQHDDHIYFLLDYEVWKKGRVIWFIMPIELPKKVYFREIYLYRYQPDLNKLEKLGVLRKEFPPRINVKYSKFKNENGKVFLAYAAGTDEERKQLVDIFVWDTKAQMFLENDFQNPLPTDHPLHEQYFNDYLSPWDANPGIVGISKLKNEILQRVVDKDYDLPTHW